MYPLLNQNQFSLLVKKDENDSITTLDKVKNLINSCDNTIDPSLLKKQLDDLLGKPIKNEDNEHKIKSKTKLISNAPSYNPTPIDELNKRKKEKELNSLKENETEEEINLNNKRIINNDDQIIVNKKSKIEDEPESQEPEIKKLLQQKTESIIVNSKD